MRVRDSSKINKKSWLFVSLIGFVLTLAVFAAFIIFSARLTEFGITKSVYYFALLPAGLFTAAFLFGAMRSYAKYSGENRFGRLELTGPVVIFALVVIGGFVFAEPENTFALTVRISSEPDNEIITNGEIILDLGSQRLVRKIDSNGEVIFADLPSKFLKSEILINSRVEGYRTKSSKKIEIPKSRVIYLKLTEIKDSTIVRGTVIDLDGNLVAEASLNFNSGLAACTTDTEGNFTTTLPFSIGSSILLTVSNEGKVKFRDYITIPENQPLIIKLD
ncbi:MAG: hypothetical protein HND52_20155 [Ignavibacteriae bacterium]|nr:hypothetical protein [Ignavibacteriota bacterium]NOH00284.1 hypothetical protein [Ignavibacteriota bacterium]